MTASPALSTATQKEAEEQDTESRRWPASIVIGIVQRTPSYTTASPKLSTATQNDGDVHETESSEDGGGPAAGDPGFAMNVVPPQRVPSNVMAFPKLSTATQNEAVGHDTASTAATVLSMRVGLLHV
jgi:hypothetical protein